MQRNKIIIFIILMLIISGCSQKPKENKTSTPIQTTVTPVPTPALIADKPGSKKGYLLFYDESLGFKIEYPQNWEKKVENEYQAVLFLSPLISQTDPFRENVNITVSKSNKIETDLKKLTDSALKDLKYSIPEFKLISQKITEINGGKIAEVTFSGTNEKNKYIWKQYYILYRNCLYNITYTSKPDNHEKYMPIVKEMLDTFEILKHLK